MKVGKREMKCTGEEKSEKKVKEGRREGKGGKKQREK